MAFITRLRLVALFSAGIATLALGLWLKLAPEQALVSGPCLCRGHSCGKATASRHDWGVRNIHLNLRMTAARANSQQQLSAARTKQVSPRRTAKVSSYTVAPAAQPHEQNESVTADLSRLEEWKLHAAMHAVAAGPDGKTVFLVMVNQAAAEHHLPFFLKSLRNLPAFTPRDVAWSGGACITDHLLVIAWDPAAHAICQQLHTPQLCLQDTIGVTEGGGNISSAITFFSDEYFEAGWRRTALAAKAVRWGFHLLITDVDIVWFQNPYKYLVGVQADVTVTNDCWSQRWQRLPNGSYPLLSGPNLGLAFLRNTPPTRRLMDAWLACKASNDSWDQKCFQQVVEAATGAGSGLTVHVAESDAFPSICCHYCELSTTTFDEQWDWKVLDECPVSKQRQWYYFHMACMKSMPNLLEHKGGKMQQLLEYTAAKRIPHP